MPVPFFYSTGIPEEGLIRLSEEASKHISQVLRMNTGERLCITDGLGKLYDAEISVSHKKHSIAAVQQVREVDPPSTQTAIGISLLKHANRFEWFVEKATEMGIGAIIPLICERTEKQTFRWNRIHNIMVSAMLQSQQAWLPHLPEPLKFSAVLDAGYRSRYIAHCEEKADKQLLKNVTKDKGAIVLIGPEGDFSPVEINQALTAGFTPVSLGNTRLRTETAGVLAAAMLTQC